MRKTFFQFICLLICGTIILSACNMPDANATSEAARPTDEPTSTATVDLAATQTRQAELLPTETPTITPTETLTPEPRLTPTFEPPKAEVVRESNCRTGPAGNYDLIATYQVGQMLEVVANDLGAGYIYVQNAENPEEQCYLLTQNIKISSGDVSVLQSITPPPSPTAAPYFTVEFKKFETCSGEDYAVFTVENAGSVPFRSFYIKVTDNKAGRSVEHVVNAFDQWTGCIIARDISPLERGATGFVHSPHFKWKVSVNDLRAVIMLCTDKDLKGTCVTQVIDLK